MAVRVDQLGVEDLDPESQLIQDIVEPFLPPNYSFCYALNASREIVNGFKYELIVVIKNEYDEEIYCEMDVLEKPWLVKDSRKFRKMTYNNCSLTNPPDVDDQMRFQFEVNPTFVNQRTQINQLEMIDMEDQIVTTKPRSTTTRVTSTTPVPDDEDEEEVSLAPLNPSSKNLLDDFFSMNNYFPPPQTTKIPSTTAAPSLPSFNEDALDEMFGIRKVEKSQAEPKINDEDESPDEKIQQKQVGNNEATPMRNEAALKDLEMDIKKVFSELFQSDPEFQSNIIALINRKDDSAVQKNYNYVVSILASRLKDKIETYNERKQDVSDDTVQVTVDPLEDTGDIRKKRSHKTNVWDLTEEALDTLDHFDTDDDKRILINILNIKEINGKNSIRIEATVANSLCQENSHETGNCEDKIDPHSMRICLLEVKFGHFSKKYFLLKFLCD